MFFSGNGCVKVANGALVADFVHFGIDIFSNSFSKALQKSSFFRFGVEIIRFWSCQIAAICGAVVRNSFPLSNPVSADRNGMVASTFLAVSAILCFASESRESHSNGCVKVAHGALAADFFMLALVIFLLNSFQKVLQNRRFSALASRSGFRAPNRCNLWSRCTKF